VAATRKVYKKNDRPAVAVPATNNLDGLLKWTLIALVVSALAEVLIWRAFSRIGVFIPKDEPRLAGFKAFYDGSVKVGEVLRNFAVVLAYGTLALLVIKLRQSVVLGFSKQAKTSRVLTIGLVATLLVFGLTVALLGLVESSFGSLVLRLAMLVAFGSLAVYYWQRNQDWVQHLFIALLFVGYLLPNTAKILHDSVFSTLGINGSLYVYEPLMEAGELAVLINAVLLFVIYTRRGNVGASLFQDIRRHWLALVGAIVLTGVFVGLTFLTVAESFIVPILALYVLGYGMHWPLALYVIGLLLLLYTLFYCLGQSRRDIVMRAGALGLLLLLLGGYSFNISDQYMFALVGLLLLARPELTAWN